MEDDIADLLDEGEFKQPKIKPVSSNTGNSFLNLIKNNAKKVFDSPIQSNEQKPVTIKETSQFNKQRESFASSDDGVYVPDFTGKIVHEDVPVNKVEQPTLQNKISSMSVNPEKKDNIVIPSIMSNNDNIKQFQNQIDEMKKNYEIVKAKKEQEQLKFVEAYNSKLQTIQNEKDDLFNKSKDLIAQIKELKAQLEMKTKELQDKSEGQSQMETLGDMLNENDLKADNEDEIALLNQEIESYKSKISNLNEKISHYESQMKNYDIFKTENESLKKNLADNKAMYEKQIADLQQTLTQKAEELKTSRRRNTTLRNSAIVQPTQQLQVLNELNEQISKLTSENKFLNKNVESMKSQIDQIKQLREKDTTFYKKEISELTRELADSKVMQATISFEKDSQIIELRTMIKKLKKYLSKN